jgi:hypothetical protein
MQYRLAGLGAFLLLAACGKGDVDLKDASVADVVKATVVSGSINPGKWSVSSEIVSVEMPGMPEQQKQMMAVMSKAMVGQTTINESCITAAQAAKPTPEMFSGKDSGDCSFETFSIDNGALSAVMNCSAPNKGPGKMHMSMQGQYGGDSYDVTSEIKMSGMQSGPAAAGMTIKSHSKGKREGACKA